MIIEVCIQRGGYGAKQDSVEKIFEHLLKTKNYNPKNPWYKILQPQRPEYQVTPWIFNYWAPKFMIVIRYLEENPRA